MAERIAILCVAWNKFSQSIRLVVLESEGLMSP